MQDFASKCCQFNAARSASTSTIMNADGIYLATYSALLLNLKLIYSGYYNGVTVRYRYKLIEIYLKSLSI